MSRDGFFFYRSHIEAARLMAAEDRQRFYEAIIDYALDGKETELSGVPALVFTAVKPILEQERDSFLNGKKGGRPRKKEEIAEEEKGGFENTKRGVSENVKPTSTSTSINTSINTSTSIGKEKVAVAPLAPVSSPIKRFVKPTLLELQQYCQEARLNINCDAFLDYYEANGWKVGRDSMKDWRAAARNWARRQVPEKRSNIVDNIHNIGDFSNERTRI